MQSITEGVDLFSSLPARFETGYTVTIRGTADKSDKKYFVKWTGSQWEEAREPGATYAIDETTMPHQLRPDGAGGWVFEKATWAVRKVGNDDTNPEPSFVGRKLRGVFFFRNRLGFLAGDSMVLSRAGSYFNFWSPPRCRYSPPTPSTWAQPPRAWRRWTGPCPTTSPCWCGPRRSSSSCW